MIPLQSLSLSSRVIYPRQRGDRENSSAISADVSLQFVHSQDVCHRQFVSVLKLCWIAVCGDNDCKFKSHKGHVVVFLRKAYFGYFPAKFQASGRNAHCRQYR